MIIQHKPVVNIVTSKEIFIFLNLFILKKHKWNVSTIKFLIL